MRQIIALTLIGALVAFVVAIRISDMIGTNTETAGANQTIPAGVADYTVLAKAYYSSRGVESTGRSGYYLTILIAGSSYETKVTGDCYNAAIIGQPLSVSCRK